jgi:transcription initiation factor IIE alpha subunit
MDLLQCLKKYGQRLDSEIAAETGVALAAVRSQLAALSDSGEVITCKLTRFENGTSVESLLYRASGYFPPRAPGRKPGPRT